MASESSWKGKEEGRKIVGGEGEERRRYTL
jgi:hypothetical protein